MLNHKNNEINDIEMAIVVNEAYATEFVHIIDKVDAKRIAYEIQCGSRMSRSGYVDVSQSLVPRKYSIATKYGIGTSTLLTLFVPGPQCYAY